MRRRMTMMMMMIMMMMLVKYKNNDDDDDDDNHNNNNHHHHHHHKKKKKKKKKTKKKNKNKNKKRKNKKNKNKNQNKNKKMNDTERRISICFTISSLRRELFPTHTLKWPGVIMCKSRAAHRALITCNMPCAVVRRNSPAIIIASVPWLKPYTNERGEETGAPMFVSWLVA